MAIPQIFDNEKVESWLFHDFQSLIFCINLRKISDSVCEWDKDIEKQNS